MTYRVAVCDDDGTQREYLKNLVLVHMNDVGATVDMHVYPSSEALLFDDVKQFDIFLLDIEMPGLNGVELAERIRESNESAAVIFVTGYAEYIAQGYDVGALHYLMKPIDKPKLFAVLDKAITVLSKRDSCLRLETGGETHRVPLGEIRYLEVNGNYVTVHAKNDVTVKKTLSDLEAELDERFARTGRSFVVNLSFVRRVTKSDVFLNDGTQVPLSRGMYESFNRAIIERL